MTTEPVSGSATPGLALVRFTVVPPAGAQARDLGADALRRRLVEAAGRLSVLRVRPVGTRRARHLDPETERVIVATRDGHVRCLSPVDGKVEWEIFTPNRFWAGPKVEHGVVYIPGGDGVLYALKARTGETLWKYSAGEELRHHCGVGGWHGLHRLARRHPVRGRSADGQVALAVPPRSPGRLLGARRVDAGGARRRRLPGLRRRLGGGAGREQWRDGEMGDASSATSGGNQFLDVDTPPVLDAAGHLYAASYKDGIACLDAKTGDLIGYSAHPGVTSLLPSGGVLFTGQRRRAARGGERA